MQKDLEGKTALVTGGARGIGRGIAERLAAAGAIVAVNYASNTHLAEDTVGAIEAAGGRAFPIQARIGGEGQIEKLVAELDTGLTKLTGGNMLDILINNIGGGEYATIATTTPDILQWTWSNNVAGPFLLTQALLDRLAYYGRVINISSTGSRLADPGIIAYSIVKAGLERFTITLANELGARGITVNSVAPGYTAVETNKHVMEDPAQYARVVDNTALRRFGDASDIADFVHALAGPAGRWITAQNIDASGGFKL